MRSDSIHSASSSALRRHDFPVVRAVGVGRAVEQRAGFLQRLEVALVVVLRAFEHQVLEQMREAGAARASRSSTDVIPDVDRHDRTAVVLVNRARRGRCRACDGCKEYSSYRVVTLSEFVSNRSDNQRPGKHAIEGRIVLRVAADDLPKTTPGWSLAILGLAGS